MGEKEEYWVNKEGETLGPFTVEEIEGKIESGSFSFEDCSCLIGGDEWSPLGELLGEPPATEDSSLEDRGDSQIVLKGGSGSSLNTLLTVFLLLLSALCSVVFMLVVSSNPGNGDNQVVDGSSFTPKAAAVDFDALKKDATVNSALVFKDGTTFLAEDDSLFSGWGITTFSSSGKTAGLTHYEEGRSVDAFTWSPNGELSNETTLADGRGVLADFFETGSKKSETTFRNGFWEGMRTTWHESGQKIGEALYKEGKLHGQSISWDENGQKTAERFYLNGLMDGRYVLLTKDGQKYDQGSFKNGLREGLRSQWTPDGIALDDETYHKGELLPVETTSSQVPVELDVPQDQDTSVSMLFDTSKVSPELKGKAEVLGSAVKKVRERFIQENALGHESFSSLAASLFRYQVAIGGPAEQGELIPLKDAFAHFRRSWGMSADSDDEGFILHVPPDSVSYGTVTLTRKDFFREMSGEHSIEDFDFIVAQSKSIFALFGMELRFDDSYKRKQYLDVIWPKLWELGSRAEDAKLFLKNQSLSFVVTETVKIKSLDKRGNSIFTEEEKEVELSFASGVVDRKLDRFAAVLQSAGARFEDFPSPQNPKLMIRKFDGLVIRSGGELYPSVSVMLAGAAPLNPDSLIRGVKVDLGEALGQPGF